MATYFLNADTGDNANDGSEGSPWLTIAKAHTEATSGDTIICQDSTATYTWGSQTFSKALTIQGEQDDGSGAVFDAGAGNITWTFNANIIISRLTFQNIVNASGWPGLLFSLGADSVSFEMNLCKFQNLAVGGRNGFNSHGLVGTTAGRTGCTVKFERNTLLPTIKSSNSGLGTGGFYFNLRNCTNTTLIIRSNTFSIGNFTGEEQMERIIEITSAAGSTVDLRNNIIYSVETQAVQIISGFAALASYQFTNNCYYTTGAAFTQVPTTGSNNITSDPLFVDIASDNYNLRPSSPCIDTGALL